MSARYIPRQKDLQKGTAGHPVHRLFLFRVDERSLQDEAWLRSQARGSSLWHWRGVLWHVKRGIPGLGLIHPGWDWWVRGSRVAQHWSWLRQRLSICDWGKRRGTSGLRDWGAVGLSLHGSGCGDRFSVTRNLDNCRRFQHQFLELLNLHPPQVSQFALALILVNEAIQGYSAIKERVGHVLFKEEGY